LWTRNRVFAFILPSTSATGRTPAKYPAFDRHTL
jgi:hypothetical protein